MTQGDLADAADINRVTVSRIENGKTMPDLETMLRLAGVFECELQDLVAEGAA